MERLGPDQLLDALGQVSLRYRADKLIDDLAMPEKEEGRHPSDLEAVGGQGISAGIDFCHLELAGKLGSQAGDHRSEHLAWSAGRRIEINHYRQGSGADIGTEIRIGKFHRPHGKGGSAAAAAGTEMLPVRENFISGAAGGAALDSLIHIHPW